MNHKDIFRGVVGAGLVFIWVVIAGCSGCHDQALDGLEERLRDDPERPGKVGTLVALDVSKEARSIAEWRRKSGDGPCEIGWELDKPFALSFDLEIDVENGQRWSENGTWEQDHQGRWEIDVDIEFVGEGQLEGVRRHRVFADKDGFWEWLGPDVVARYGADGEVKRGWKREFGARFSGAMLMTSDTWQRSDEISPTEQVWIPGGKDQWCGPMENDQISSWSPLFGARAIVKTARIVTGQSTEAEGGDCRRIEARFELRTGESMDLRFQECMEPASKELVRSEAEKIVEVRRPRHRAAVAEQLESWIDEGIIQPSQ